MLDLEDIARELERNCNEEGWEALRHGQKRQGEHAFQNDPVMVFGAFNWDFDPAADQMRRSQDLHVGPFPHETRREIYRCILDDVARVSGKTSVSICDESERMWDELGPRMRMTPADFVCNCGPQCVPGHPMYSVHAK